MKKSNTIFKDVYLGDEHPYLRPYICDGDPCNGKICFVGINPATPIYPNQISREEFMKLITNYDKFIDFYISNRKKERKTDISRTRQGMNSFFKWIKSFSDYSIIETDVYTYPTKNIKELKSVDNKILNISRDVFFEVLKKYKPKILIMHGKTTLNIFEEIISEKGIQLIKSSNLINIKDIENNGKYGSINIDGQVIEIFACRHFMYYGKSGNSFKEFRKNLKSRLTTI